MSEYNQKQQQDLQQLMMTHHVEVVAGGVIGYHRALGPLCLAATEYVQEAGAEGR